MQKDHHKQVKYMQQILYEQQHCSEETLAKCKRKNTNSPQPLAVD